MRVVILLSSLILLLSGCLSYNPKELKSPCVSISNPDGTPSPCVKRKVNDHWLV